VTDSTFSGNAASSGGAIEDAFGQLKVSNSILADSTSGGNCFSASGKPLDAGYNISDDTSCGFGGTGANGKKLGDGVDPLLDSKGLQSNGGPTETIALEPLSPAIAAIPLAECKATTDQRGSKRPAPGYDACDIGAYEYQAKPASTPTPTSTPAPTKHATQTPTPGSETPTATAAVTARPTPTRSFATTPTPTPLPTRTSSSTPTRTRSPTPTPPMCVSTTPLPTVPAPTPTPLLGHPRITSVQNPIPVGGSFVIKGGGFTKKPLVNFFVATAAGPISQGPLTPASSPRPSSPFRFRQPLVRATDSPRSK